MALAYSGSSLVSRRSPPSRKEERWPLTGHVMSAVEQMDDEALVALVKGSDQGQRQEALAAIFNRYYDLLLQYFLNRGLNSAVADDLWAETWARAFDKICSDAYEYQGKLVINFLYRIAHFVLLEHHRGKGDEQEMLNHLWIEQQIQQTREEWGAFGQGHAAEQLESGFQEEEGTNDEKGNLPEYEQFAVRDRKLHEALSGLSPKRREIILLTHFGGMTSKEVAAEVGMTSDAVRQNLSRAYKTLRGLLGS